MAIKIDLENLCEIIQKRLHKHNDAYHHQKNKTQSCEL